MLRARGAVTCVLIAALVGCGGNVVFAPDDETSGVGGSVSTLTVGGGFDCGAVSFDLDVPPMVCTNGSDQCEIIGLLPDGRDVRESCDGVTLQCSLYIDEVFACSCPADRIDFASTCPNSVPTCSDWLVSWSTAEICIIN